MIMIFLFKKISSRLTLNAVLFIDKTTHIKINLSTKLTIYTSTADTSTLIAKI